MYDCGIRAQPNEGCALLFGKKFQEMDPSTHKSKVVYVVDLVDCIQSSQLSWGSFHIDEKVLYERSERSDLRNYKLVGIYHSHPALAEPSSMDKEYMNHIDAFKPIYAVWIIQSTVGPKETRAYICLHNTLYEVRQEIN